MSARLRLSFCLAVSCLLSGLRSLPAEDTLPAIVISPGSTTAPVSAPERLPEIVPASTRDTADPPGTAAHRNDSKTRAAETPPARQTKSRREKPGHRDPKRGTESRRTESSRQAQAARESASRRAREEWQKQLTAAKAARGSADGKPAKKRSRGRTAEKSSAAGQRKHPQRKAVLMDIIPQPVRRPRYIAIYRSIPFSRAQYDADPSYRHNATMELLLGQLRPAAPSAQPRVNVTVQSLADPGLFSWPRYSYPLRSGYRAWSRYPWH